MLYGTFDLFNGGSTVGGCIAGAAADVACGAVAVLVGVPTGGVGALETAVTCAVVGEVAGGLVDEAITN